MTTRRLGDGATGGGQSRPARRVLAAQMREPLRRFLATEAGGLRRNHARGRTQRSNDPLRGRVGVAFHVGSATVAARFGSSDASHDRCKDATHHPAAQTFRVRYDK